MGHAHLDIVWLWRYPDGLQALKATFRSALDRMREYPDFRFAAGSAAYYDFIERNDPAMFEEIRLRVGEGRWQPVGGWWVEPDLNLPAGESLVRQALQGQHYFKSRFGRFASVGFNPDSFGHPGSLPQLLAGARLPNYVFMRPMPNEKGLPGRDFRWRSPDGAEVVAYRVPYEYCTPGGDIESHVARCRAELIGPGASLMCFYGVGNHGGGPTRANLDSILRLRSAGEEVELAFSDPESYFAGIGQAELPVVQDDLQQHAPGCYAAHSGVKAWNRRAENALLTAEKLSAIAALLGGPAYPLQDLRHAWRQVLFHQFHDILAGTSLESAYPDARDAFGEATAIAGRAAWNAALALAWRIDIPEGEPPITVFNPNAWRSLVPVELETDGLGGATHLEDPEGADRPLQEVRSEATAGGRKRVAFLCDLPPLGYRVYRAVRRGAAEPRFDSRFRLTIDAASGFVTSLYDQLEECEVLFKAGGRPVVIDDPSDTWGHDVIRFDGAAQEMELERVELPESGPVRQITRVVHRLGGSRVIQDYVQWSGLDLVEVRVAVDWHERRKLLKLRWPLALDFRRATYETPHGTTIQPCDGAERPVQSWLDVSGIQRTTARPYGVAFLNDGKQSADVRGREVGLTVLRSPVYAHHDPYRPESWDGLRFMDQGWQSFTYWLVPHGGGWESAGVPQRAAELNQPPLALVDAFHPGDLAAVGAFVEVGPPNVVLAALKLAEDGSGDLILRAREVTGCRVRAQVALHAAGKTFAVDFGAHQLKTLRISEGGGTLREVDLLEL